ncbi:MAG: hypothetical protein AAF646_00760 [Pseudomonadota bacterium]
MSAARRLGPTTARNWGWVSIPAAVALTFGAGAIEATWRLGFGWQETGLPLSVALPAGALALWLWRQPPFERTTLVLTKDGLCVEGRRLQVALAWEEIAAITFRPSSMGPAHMTLERAAATDDGAGGASEDPVTPAAYLTAKAEAGLGDAPGLMFPVRATGARAEEIVAFLARGAAEAGFEVSEPMRGDARALHRLPGPRRWTVVRREA